MKMERFDPRPRQVIFRVPTPPDCRRRLEDWLSAADASYAQSRAVVVGGPVLVLVKWHDTGVAPNMSILRDWLDARDIAPSRFVKGYYRVPVKSLSPKEAEVRITSLGAI